MKIKLILILGCCFVFSCQNQEDDRLDFVKEIDKAIGKYDKTAKIKFEKDSLVKEGRSVLKMYEEDETGMYKIEGNYSAFNFDFNYELYVQNDNVIFEREQAFTPWIYKGKRDDSEPCCQVFERLNYFKDTLLQKQYLKELNVMEVNDKPIKIKELEALVFKEISKENIQYNNSNSKETLERLKKQFVN